MASRFVDTRDGSKRIELAGRELTIGRGDDCEVQIRDERISTRHCRLVARDDGWTIEDLKSTNRTFVNGDLIGEQPRRLAHGDIVRLGVPEARLFEAQFVNDAAAQEARAARIASEGWHRKHAALQAELHARNADQVRMAAELERVGGLHRRLQDQVDAHALASAAAKRGSERMADELATVREELAALRADHAACRPAAERLQRRCAELEAQLESQARKARRELDDGEQRCKKLASELGLATSELATARHALAVAIDNVRILQQANDDLLLRLRHADHEVRGPHDHR